MKYNFDQEINRMKTACEKWDDLETRFGVNDVLPMWVADMDFKAPPAVIETLKERVEHGIYGYTYRPDSYFEAIVDWVSRRHQWSIQKEWITHSPGVIPALAFLLRSLTQPGDKIIVQSPVYHHFFRVIESQGRTVVNNPLSYEDGRYTMDFADLEAQIDSSVKMLILCSPHNPVGRVWTREELTLLGEICLKHNILIVSDEIHFDLVYNEYKHVPIASISEALAKQTITCFSPSKTFNIWGVQTSVVIIPNCDLRERYNREINSMAIGWATPFGIAALESAYRFGEEWLDQLIDYLKGNVDFVESYLQNNIPQIKLVKPEGTYLLWLDFRELGFCMEELDQFMLQKARLALNEGHIFGQGGEGFMRMNIACPRTTLEKALLQLERAVKQLSPIGK
ncbi:cystathionine beta-lyase [Bacillus sp. MUM 116]|uniref:MalY/PatB family protein n=1 Tax=Bacillus sp. MUM 116 TaxID=1678002 RepID=UPI0008F5EC17|nr:MalY/PatB family protein [Bacillus sp. MUM 116]OIK12979.1 cystathionine beta-lyase [Bacillus sp. MUM 116]